ERPSINCGPVGPALFLEVEYVGIEGYGAIERRNYDPYMVEHRLPHHAATSVPTPQMFQSRPWSPTALYPVSVTINVSSSLMKPNLRWNNVVSIDNTMPGSRGRSPSSFG